MSPLRAHARFVAVLFLMLVTGVARGAPRPLDRIVAVVDRAIVTLSDVRARARPVIQQATIAKGRPPTQRELDEITAQMTERLVDEHRVQIAARERRLEVADDEITPLSDADARTHLFHVDLEVSDVP